MSHRVQRNVKSAYQRKEADAEPQRRPSQAKSKIAKAAAAAAHSATTSKPTNLHNKSENWTEEEHEIFLRLLSVLMEEKRTRIAEGENPSRYNGAKFYQLLQKRILKEDAGTPTFLTLEEAVSHLID
jgi:hypothetical protein